MKLMSEKISVVIPTLNSATALPETLVCLMEGLHTGLIQELIISDAGSLDETRQIAEAVGAVFIQGPASRGGQLRRGCAVAKAQWLMVLHADTHLQGGWTRVVREHLQLRQGAAYFRLRFRAAGLLPRLFAKAANLRAGTLGLAYGDQGLLIRQKDYQRLGGFPDQVLMEDVEIMRRIRQASIGLSELSSDALTSAERFQKVGWWRQGGRNVRLLCSYFLGVNPATLAKRYSAPCS